MAVSESEHCATIQKEVTVLRFGMAQYLGDVTGNGPAFSQDKRVRGEVVLAWLVFVRVGVIKLRHPEPMA